KSVPYLKASKGASSGIGEGIAYTFARNGAILSLTGRHKENLDKVAEKCKKEGATRVIRIIGDLVEKEDIERIVEETSSKLGQIDVLINNAGAWASGGIENATIEDCDLLYKVNMRAPYYLIQKCVPHLKKTKGCVVNVSSCFSNMTMVFALHYSMGKCALDHLTKSAAL
uniref:Uncharacterized protein n=1 Tax=Ciona savignyi TaxID=51511 RepID=H2YH42_CIOSA